MIAISANGTAAPAARVRGSVVIVSWEEQRDGTENYMEAKQKLIMSQTPIQRGKNPER